MVLAGKLNQKAAEDVHRKAVSAHRAFIPELIESGLVSASELAHTLSQAFSAPLIDVEALDPQLLPHNLIDVELSQKYRLLGLGKRGGRLVVVTADPSDHEAAEKIKFVTQMSVEWVIGEFDKLSQLIKAHNKSTTDSMDSIIGQDFEFDEASLGSDAPAEEAEAAQTDVEDAPVVKFLHKVSLYTNQMIAKSIYCLSR